MEYGGEKPVLGAVPVLHACRPNPNWYMLKAGEPRAVNFNGSLCASEGGWGTANSPTQI